MTQDETFTGGLCLITMDPESNFIILEQPAQARDQVSWNAWMAPALAQFNCRVIQSTSDEASGLLAYGEHYLERVAELRWRSFGPPFLSSPFVSLLYADAVPFVAAHPLVG